MQAGPMLSEIQRSHLSKPLNRSRRFDFPNRISAARGFAWRA